MKLEAELEAIKLNRLDCPWAGDMEPSRACKNCGRTEANHEHESHWSDCETKELQGMIDGLLAAEVESKPIAVERKRKLTRFAIGE